MGLVKKGEGELGISQLQVQNTDVMKGLSIFRKAREDFDIGLLSPSEIILLMEGQGLPEPIVAPLCGLADHEISGQGSLRANVAP